MIPTVIEKYIFNEIGAPRVITCAAQLDEYVAALMELDRRGQLTVAEGNFAELLILLIEAYVENRHFTRFVPTIEEWQGLLSAKDPSQKN